jgi:hypothetical protein
MTGFFCLLNRAPLSGSVEGAQNVEWMIREGSAALTRSGHPIQSYRDNHIAISCFDNEAWQPAQKLYDEDDAVAWVAGNPLLTRASGTVFGLSEGRTALRKGMVERDMAALASTRGSFAGLVWLKARKTLVLCADKLALRPVYIMTSTHHLAASTSLRCLVAATKALISPSRIGLGERLLMGVNLGGHTIYSGVERIRPAELIQVNMNQKIHLSYFDWRRVSCPDEQEGTSVQALYELFLDAVSIRSNSEVEEALLSGGLDSRCVVAGLIDIGREVRTFSSSYRGSLDDELSRTMAEKLEVSHFQHHRRPADRVLLEQDNFGLYARSHFPPSDGKEVGARRLWSGDGGSVGLGHVYLDAQRVKLASASMDHVGIQRLFPTLASFRRRIIRPKMQVDLLQSAINSCEAEFVNLSTAYPGRRLFLFYILNDQSRHLDLHYEDIDVTNIELETPFFDPDFLKAVMSFSIDKCLYHQLYHEWIAKFGTPITAVAWQPYPGHLECPLPLPTHARSQWGVQWHDRAAQQALNSAAGMALAAKDEALWAIVSRRRLRFFHALSRMGVERWNHELATAIKLHTWITNLG